MKTQVKIRGDSKVIVLSKEFIKFHDIKVGDWLDMSDVIKVNKSGPEYVN